VVFVDQAAEDLSALDPGDDIDGMAGSAPRGLLLQPLVRSMTVVVPCVLGQDFAEMLLAEDQHVVQTLAAGAGNPAFRDCVRARRPDGRLNDPDPGIPAAASTASNGVCVKNVGANAFSLVAALLWLHMLQPARQASSEMPRHEDDLGYHANLAYTLLAPRPAGMSDPGPIIECMTEVLIPDKPAFNTPSTIIPPHSGLLLNQDTGVCVKPDLPMQHQTPRSAARPLMRG
jgi:hypothetical protein